MRQPLSLKARALAMLARREHSRSELRRKLLPHARAAALEKALAAAAAPGAGSPASAEAARLDDSAELAARTALPAARPTGAAAGEAHEAHEVDVDSGAALAAPRSARLATAAATLAQLQAAHGRSGNDAPGAHDDLHRSPGPAPARPGIFSSRSSAKDKPKSSARRGGWGRRGARWGQGDDDAEAAAAGPDDERDPDQADDFDVPAPPPAQPAVDTAAAWAEADSDLEVLLDWLQANRYLSEERFVESRVHARAGRFGNLRIRQELARHGVALGEDTAQQLRDTELQRCREVWARKFGGEPPADAAARARQMRFLAARGFSADVIRRVLQARDD